MKALVLGLDGATWDILGPLTQSGDLPNLARLMEEGAHGTLRSVFPPLSPVAWTGVMTGKNSGRHGVFEFLEFAHDPRQGRVNSSRSIRSDLVWEIAGRHGKATVAGAVPLSYPPRPFPGFFLGDFLSPAGAADFASDPAILAELEAHLGAPYRPWSTAVHDGGREAEALDDLTAFLDQHLRAVRFLMKRCPWDLFLFDLMATDRIQHELWHAWDPNHRAARGRDLSAVRAGFIDFWRRLDAGIGAIASELPPETNLILMSDHGFGPIEWYVNFNVWLLEEGFIALNDSFYVRQKHWFHRHGATPGWFYGLMARLGLGSSRVGRFRGKQLSWVDRLADSVFLSRRHIDWSRTRAYAQGNFGQIFLNVRNRQPDGCVDPADVRPLLDDLKARLAAIRHPETGSPLIDRIFERDELYHGPYAELAPDLTVVPGDWRYRTIGLYDFTTNEVISPAFGPTGDHRLDGVLIAHGPAVRAGSRPEGANLLDIAPTLLHLLGVPAPDDLDGRVLSEILDPSAVPTPTPTNGPEPAPPRPSDADRAVVPASYNDEDDAAIQQRLADLGYL